MQILSTLEKSLSADLTYHSVAHTIDVANVCNDYIKYYKIDGQQAKMIRIASIGHDLGYITSPIEHEERGIKELSTILPAILNDQEIEIVNGMIRATKVPQNPQNFLEEILADADLDYLGRPDYDLLSESLYKEFLHFGVVNNPTEWLDVQIKFLENHHYHTSYAIENRSAIKLAKLQELKEKRKALDY